MNEDNDILKALRQQMKEQNKPEGHPFCVPEGYFPELENKVLAKISGEEAADPMPLTNEGKKQTFTVPDGYFDSIGQNILKKNTSPAPVRKLFPSRWRQTAAATITGLIILSGVYYLGQTDSQKIAVQNRSDITPAIRDISANELEGFAEEGSSANISSNDKKKSVDINQLFQQVSSQDLESFLNETASNNTELF